MGISKKELLQEYYMDEIGAVIEEYADLIDPKKKEKRSESTIDEHVSVLEFLGAGGEFIDS